MSILEALATDRLCIEPTFYEGDLKYQQARNRYCTLGEKLLNKLNEEEKKLLEDYSTALSDENLLYGNDRFIRGFRLGVLMMMEVVMNEDDLILPEEKVHEDHKTSL